MQQLLLYIIGDSQAFTTSYYVEKNAKAIEELRNNMAKTLKIALNRDLSDGEISGLVDICKILQTCDSGAYTRYGVTRKEGTKFYYYNGNDRFTKGFDLPQGLNKKSLRMIEPEQK